MKFEKIESVLQCHCGSGVKKIHDKFSCMKCNKIYPIKDGKAFFTDEFIELNEWNHEEFKFDLFERTNKINMPNVVGGPRLKDLVNELEVNKIKNFIAVNLGGGQDKFEDVYNFDLGNYQNVDFITSLYNLPLRDSSVDFLMSNSVLEHVEFPDKVLDEATRVLKKNGLFYLCVPSVCLRHHKMDFTRWTMPGLQNLLKLRGFKIIKHGACRGPGWVIWHVLESFVVSRTNKGFLREFLRKFVMIITKPFVGLKVRDNEKEENMALTIYVIAKKI